MSAEKKLAWFEAFSAVNQQFIDHTVRRVRAAGVDRIPEILRELTAAYSRKPERWAEIQHRYQRSQWQLWSDFSRASVDGKPSAIVAPQVDDKRFRDPAWNALPFFDYMKQSYLLTANGLHDLIESAELDPVRKNQLAFHAQQYLDAIAPSNFLATNPEALQLALETGGQSLARGLENLARDVERGRISMSDESSFEVGKNLAVTAGAVVFENDYLQLIQYAPLTETVYRRPLLIVPPVINKYYILDLQPENSFVRFALQQGHTVFMISWRNVGGELGGATWDDYVESGVEKAMRVVRAIVRADKINALGFCIGGTLLATTLAVQRVRKRNPVASLTLLATMLDFADPGKISAYMDDAYLSECEIRYAGGEIMHGAELAEAFANLRANELVWSYVVNNYLKGQTPRAFDFLYWNADTVNLPGALYAFLVKKLYHENRLKAPGQLSVCGAGVDLGRVDMATYLLASREDHIVPWQTAYASTRLLRGQLEFVLAASGHIAGVINPPEKGRRNYWINPDHPLDGAEWLSGAASVAGSWWTHWSAWIARHAGKKIKARGALGNTIYEPIEAAPGRYVKASS
ncbi:MAG: class I poly(R)-hydroxyalkanoic acid synthase [Pseudomonadota bacterium]|nr:class I poly(R)-hydroxyalkanoic acid synthase [Pseudomonadota bacterium]